MMDINNIAFPAAWSEDEKARAKTEFLKKLALLAHKFYGGKMQTLPKCSVSLDMLNVWYTPGASKISTTIRDDNDSSFSLSNRGNLVAVVSDSTRVLGDGDCTPTGGLGVMEGKALLMKYLGGIDAVALCIDSRENGSHNPQKIIDFVKMVSPSFGAINLEDISQPNCFRVLDELRDTCDIPVWHDDAQGTACIILAGLLNALKLAEKPLADAKIVLLGAGAANTTVARFILADGGDPSNMTLFDVNGALHIGRVDIERDMRYYQQWELCRKTNPKKVRYIEEALQNADVLIALSAPGPGIVKPEWVRSMANKAVVFACANPTPEIWPHTAKEAGAFIIATGRGDFPNQVNNSLCFPGLLKGALLARSRKITDNMAIRCSHSIADFSEKRGISPNNIIVDMSETVLFSEEAGDVAAAAVAEGVARINISREEARRRARADTATVRSTLHHLEEAGDIPSLPEELVQKVLKEVGGVMVNEI
ncbi:MAG: NADP-dependent malic enzyme [Treponema sp.]|jgi:malate dehydrogenase (oxaloacetate-decarboxylating)|nr:NADP-dependent malic enzyme [Treponema sp.]